MREPESVRRRLFGHRRILFLVLGLSGIGVMFSLLVFLGETWVLKQVEKRVRDSMLECRAFHRYVQYHMHPAYKALMNEGRLPQGFYAPELLSSSYITRNFQQHYNEERRKLGLPEVRYKMAAVDPRNPVNKADAFERSIIAWFNEDRSRTSYREVVEEEGEKFLLYANPFLEVEERCLKCHGKPEDAPAQLRDTYQWTGAWNLKPGEIIAAEFIRSPLEGEFDAMTAFIGGLVLLSGLGMLLLFFNYRLRALVGLRTRELQESEQRYRAVAEDAPVMIFRLSPAGTILFSNETAQRYFRPNGPALEGAAFFDLMAEADAPTVRAALARLSAAAPVAALEHHMIGLEGAASWHAWIYRAIFNGQGHLEAYQTIGEDIGARKKAEAERERLLWERGERVKELRCMFAVAELIRTEEQLTAIFEQMVALLPPGWQYPEITCCRLRYDEAEYLSEGFNESEWRQAAAIIVAGVKHGELEVFYREARPDADEGPFINEERELLDSIASCLGNTIERHQVEGQLRQAQKMEAVGQLAGGIAHDFNNLLQAILGYGEMALEDAGADRQIGASLREILRAGGRAKTLVSQLLAFSRQQVLEMKEVNLNETTQDLMKMLRRILGEHISLRFIPAQELGMVRADPSQIGQILINLCVNARDAMPGGGEITIETENVLIEPGYQEIHPWICTGRYVLLSVTDSGCGMDAQTMGQIFEPFFTTKGVGEGTGLGLSMVYGLVKQHQGVIHVYSEPGMGATFKVYFPLLERSAKSVGPKIQGAPPRGKETILLAEDDDMVRGLAAAFLKNAGYTLFVAQDGEEALELFKAHAKEIDLALLDVVMPKLGGRAVYERLHKQRPDLPVLFSSGYSMNAVHTNFVLDEGLELIQKPFQRDELLRKVRAVLDQAHALH